jgi:hypothetical protein
MARIGLEVSKIFDASSFPMENLAKGALVGFGLVWVGGVEIFDALGALVENVAKGALKTFALSWTE